MIIHAFNQTLHCQRLAHRLCLHPHSAVKTNSNLKGENRGDGGQDNVVPIKKTTIADYYGPVDMKVRNTYRLHSWRVILTITPPFNSPKPSDLPVLGSKHSSSGSISRLADITRANTNVPTYLSSESISLRLVRHPSKATHLEVWFAPLCGTLKRQSVQLGHL